MDAAVTVFAEYGVEAAPISKITATAKVSNGVFYYHFKDKAELVDAVAHAVAAALVNQVDKEIANITDGAERVALATQIFIRLAAAEEAWGWLAVQAMIDMGQFRDQISSGIRKDVGIGIKQGYFDVEPSDVLFTMLLSVVAVSLRQHLERVDDQKIELSASSMILRMLGVPPKQATNLSLKMRKKYVDTVGGSKKRRYMPSIKIR
jgi:AcrR family transcriptional regulator